MNEGVSRFQSLLISKGYDLGKWGADGDFGRISKAAALKYINHLCKNTYGYQFVDNSPYWFRLSNDFTDQFTDFVVVVRDGEVVSGTAATTKAGNYGVYNPLTVGGITGVGVIVAGQYLNSHAYRAKGKRKWGSDAGYFEQIRAIKVHRDGNKDLNLDKNIIQYAPNWYGFFFHAMGSGRRVWNWSLGCLGTPYSEWRRNIDPYFMDGQIVSCTVFEV